MTLPIRMWLSVLIGGAPSLVDEPNAVSQVPLPGTSTYTMAPGTLSSPIRAVIFGPRSAANAGAAAGAVGAAVDTAVGAAVDAGGAEPAGPDVHPTANTAVTASATPARATGVHRTIVIRDPSRYGHPSAVDARARSAG